MTSPRMNTPANPGRDTMIIQPPLSRHGRGPGLVILADSDLDLGGHEKTLDPPPVRKWAEEGYALAQVSLHDGLVSDDLDMAIARLQDLGQCEQTSKIGVIIYSGHINTTMLQIIGGRSQIAAVVFYGNYLGMHIGSQPTLAHIAGIQPKASPFSQNLMKCYFYPQCQPFFTIPSGFSYNSASSALSHTRTLSFLKPLLGGPYFDLEKIWDEHTYWEFEARSVEHTMATMVEQPYVNHIPTMTGGIGREALTKFYRDHFIFANPADTELELISRTVGIDRVIDEFLFKCTHDRVVDWLAPGVPPTGKYISIPFTSVMNIRGDRLYHEHISWDSGTLLRQLGLLPEYLPFTCQMNPEAEGKKFEYRLPVAGVECARKLADESSEPSNRMLDYEIRETKSTTEL